MIFWIIFETLATPLTQQYPTLIGIVQFSRAALIIVILYNNKRFLSIVSLASLALYSTQDDVDHRTEEITGQCIWDSGIYREDVIDKAVDRATSAQLFRPTCWLRVCTSCQARHVDCIKATCMLELSWILLLPYYADAL
jgi:hypothetical protein